MKKEKAISLDRNIQGPLTLHRLRGRNLSVLRDNGWMAEVKGQWRHWRPEGSQVYATSAVHRPARHH